MESAQISFGHHEFLKDVLTLLLLLAVIGYCMNRFAVMQGGIDFPEFYSAARLLAQGHGHEIYNVAAQNNSQVTYTGRIGTYFNHPSFELLIYLPFCFLPVKDAYLLWSLLSLALLGVTAKLLQRELWPSQSWRILLLGSLIFVPILLTLIQGQDSILLLFLITKSFVSLKHEKEFRAGGWLALGLFKFQIVLPIIFLAGIMRRRAVLGFSVVLAFLALTFIAISGWHAPIEYARFLMHTSTLPLAGIHPQAMANLRGLSTQFLSLPRLSLAITIVASLLVVGLALRDAIRSGNTGTGDVDLTFAEAIVAATLVSYHISPHDLSILLLPITWTLLHASRTWKTSWFLHVISLTTCIVLLLPPLHLWLLDRHQYVYMVVPLVTLFAVMRTGFSWRFARPTQVA